MKKFTCLRMSLGLASVVATVGFFVLAGIASAQGPAVSAGLNADMRNAQERVAIQALQSAPGASGQNSAGQQIGVDILFPRISVDNIMFVELQSEDVPVANQRFHQPGTWAEHLAIKDSANRVVSATFRPGDGLQGGHVYDVNIYGAAGDKHLVGRITVVASASPQVFRFEAAGFGSNSASAANTQGTAEQNDGSAEVFDLSGLPAEPTNFTEQRLQALLGNHRKGDLGDAAMIQDLIAQDYQARGDQARAQAAEQRAVLARRIARGY